MGLLFCNLPIVLAYLKHQSKAAVVLSLVVIIYSHLMLDVSIIWLLIKYSCYFVIYFIGVKRNIKDNTFIVVIVVLQGFFLSFEYFSLFSFNSFITMVEIFIMMVLFYLLPFFLLYLFKLADRITNLHLTVSELEKDKQLRNSLFKITHEVKNPIAVCRGYLDMMDVNDPVKTLRYVS